MTTLKITIEIEDGFPWEAVMESERGDAVEMYEDVANYVMVRGHALAAGLLPVTIDPFRRSQVVSASAVDCNETT